MTYYISVTGLEVTSLWYMPKFFWYSLASKQQAEAAPGNIKAELQNPINGVWHTVTVWEDRASMTKFMTSGAHAQAMKIGKQIYREGKTKVYGYESETIPTWHEAYQLWKENGTLHGKPPVVKEEIAQKSSGGSSSTSLLIVAAGGLGVVALVVGYIQQYHPELFDHQSEATITASS